MRSTKRVWKPKFGWIFIGLNLCSGLIFFSNSFCLNSISHSPTPLKQNPQSNNQVQVASTIPIPDYINYLQQYWAWDQKLKPINQASPIDYTNYLNPLSNFFPSQLSFMSSDYGFNQYGDKTSSHPYYSHGFSSILANFGIMFGVAYGDNQVNPFNGPGVAFLYYPILGIDQINILPSNITWIDKAENDWILEIKSSTPENFYFYSIEFIGTATPTPSDLTTIAVRSMDDDSQTSNYQQAIITFTTLPGAAHTVYNPFYIENNGSPDPIEMIGGIFQVQYAHIVSLSKNNFSKIKTNEQTYLTLTTIYAHRNMYGFYNTIQNETTNTTTYQLLGLDTSILATGTNPTTLNTTGILYMPNYTGQPPTTTNNSNISSAIVLGTILGSCLIAICTVGFGVLIYQRQMTIQTVK